MVSLFDLLLQDHITIIFTQTYFPQCFEHGNYPTRLTFLWKGGITLDKFQRFFKFKAAEKVGPTPNAF